MPSYFRPEIVAMHGYVPGEQPQDGKFIKLNTNENPYPPSPAVQRAIGRRRARACEVSRSDGRRPFAAGRREVLGVEPDWILCGNGSDDILTIVTRALVGQGEWLRLPYPSYILYKTLAQLQGAEAEEVHFRTRLVAVRQFRGRRDRFEAGVSAQSQQSVGHDDLRPSGCWNWPSGCPARCWSTRRTSISPTSNCLSLVQQNDKIMVSRSLSKSYALAGLRFGFSVAQPQIIEQLVKVKDSYNCDALAIAGATAAIDDQAWLAENRAKILATRARLTAGMRELGFSRGRFAG